MPVRTPRVPLLHRAIAHCNLQPRPLHMIFQERRHKAHIAQLNKLARKARLATGIADTLYRRFMITAESPRNTNYQDIISRVPTLNQISAIPVYARESLSVVILTTPSFTTWLENDDFMSQLLTSIVGTKRVSTIDYPRVNVVSAVVDRLPPPGHDGSPGKEGFSILYGSPACVLPDYQMPSSPPDCQASIMFSFNRSFKKSSYSIEGNPSRKTSLRSLPKSIVLPLAKTIFQNGRDSTLIASEWKKGDTDREYQKIHQSDKAFERIISLPVGGSLVPHVPVIALTAPRLIVSGMGNIIRQLKSYDEGGAIFPASQELEANVSDYFKRLNLPPAAVSVWAVILEPNFRESKAKLKKNKKLLKLQEGWTERGRCYQNFPNISRTASSVHRVLSGGGGWGLKQGLVSLDPQSERQFLPSSESKLVESDELEPEGLSDIIVRPGSSIQFFLAENPSPERVQDVWGLQAMSHRNIPKHDQSLYLGTTPSSIDQIPDTSLENSDQSKNDRFFSVYDSHFGALSEQGIFIIQEDVRYNKIRSTKLDIPSSWIEHYGIQVS